MRICITKAVRWVDTVVRGCGSSLLIASIFSMKYRNKVIKWGEWEEVKEVLREKSRLVVGGWRQRMNESQNKWNC